ncbi:MAG TPA: hypothetical protein VIP46_06150 [Pyrinomonadaceae bacterium]
MRFFVFLLVALEVLQVAVIAALAVGYRNLRRRVDENYSFTERQPRSITDDGSAG